MSSDDKKIKTDPATKNDVPSKDKSTSVDTSTAEGGKIADTVPYSRGEGQNVPPNLCEMLLQRPSIHIAHR